MKQFNNHFSKVSLIMKHTIIQLISDVFYISLVTFIVFLMLELLKEGLISNYFDLNLLLLISLAFGTATIIINTKKND